MTDLEIKSKILITAQNCFLKIGLPPIEIYFKTAGKKFWGKFFYRVCSKTGELDLIKICINVEMIKQYKEFDRCRTTTIHEIAHYYQWKKLGYTDHDKNFDKINEWLLRNID